MTSSPRCQKSELKFQWPMSVARLSVAKGPCQASVKSPETQGGFSVGEAMLVTAVVSDHCKFYQKTIDTSQKADILGGLDSKYMIWCENIAWCRNRIVPVGTFCFFHFCIPKSMPLWLHHFQEFPTKAGLFASGTAKIYVALAPWGRFSMEWSDGFRKSQRQLGHQTIPWTILHRKKNKGTWKMGAP